METNIAELFLLMGGNVGHTQTFGKNAFVDGGDGNGCLCVSVFVCI